MAHTETVIAWLNDAYAMENSLIQVMENHAKDAKGHATIQAKIQDHIEQTRRHAELVKSCIERLGGHTSAIKSGLSTVTGMMQGMSTGMAKDELVKNALADYAAEHFEIACYTSLISAAHAVGDGETARICRQILDDEEKMASWLEQQIPIITQEHLGQRVKEHGSA